MATAPRVRFVTGAMRTPNPDARTDTGPPNHELRRAVVQEVTPRGYGYCGGLTEKAGYHVDHVIPALCRVLRCTEDELAQRMGGAQP